MGRDVTGLRVSSLKEKPTAVSKTPTKVPEAKPSVNKGVTEASPVEKSNAKLDVLGVKSPNLEVGKNDAKSSKIEESKLSSPDKSGDQHVYVSPIPAETPALSSNTSSRIEETKLSSPDRSGDQHVYVSPIPAETPVLCSNTSSKIEETKFSTPDKSGDQHEYVSPIPAETPGLCSNTSPNMNVLPSPCSSKKAQSNSPFISRKRLDDEDNWSTGSSITASVRVARFKTTVPLAPKFCVTDRLEKRKEFYTKLEEKHMALEAEKREYEARNKEEEQATIKQMRKNMVYKANPVPNFYYEGPPPKKELKKLPTTRAISPKFGRRKSLGDLGSSSAEEKVFVARATRHSLGGYKQGSVTLNSTPKKKGPVHEQNNKGSLKKERSKLVTKEPASAPTSVQESVANISFQS